MFKFVHHVRFSNVAPVVDNSVILLLVLLIIFGFSNVAPVIDSSSVLICCSLTVRKISLMI